MCGIVGTLNIDTHALIEPETLRSMLGAVRHRGPDQFGLYVYQDGRSGVGLGSARLSIIDLGGGQQPISNEDETVWIVFNGEIYNYLELREALVRDGHRLSTDSDTEVIVHLYEHVGPACVDYLNGQFAFAIWDERTHTLFMARDRLGIRPLYYTLRDGALLFASEVKALLADPRVSGEVDPVALDQTFTFWSPLSPRTPFKGIQTLPPGHRMLAQPKAEIQVERYWEPSFSEERMAETKVEGLESAARRLRHLLVDATQLRLRADVPVGAYLSGGLDSSTIAALIRHHTSNRLETFSIAFTDEDYDESKFQRQMAEHLGTRHHLITCTHEDIGRVFPDVIWHTETPIMRTSPAPLYLLSKLVHNHDFKVVLTGEGADEFLAGYNIFKETKIRRFWARQPDSQIRPALLRRLYPYIGQLAVGNTAYLERFFGQGLTDVASPAYSHAIRWRNTGRTRRFFSPALKHALAEIGSSSPADVYWPEEFEQWNWLSRAQYLEITVFLAEYLLSSQGDRMAMAHSVEGRFPFLDHRVAEFCNQLPPHFKLRGLNEKYLLKRAMRDLLPEEIWSRPKRPYRAPIHRSFFPDGKPLEWVAELLSTEQVESAGYFNARAVDKLLQKIDRFGTLGETDEMALAGLLSTQLLHWHFVADYQLPPPIDAREDVKVVLRGNSQERATLLPAAEDQDGALTRL